MQGRLLWALYKGRFLRELQVNKFLVPSDRESVATAAASQRRHSRHSGHLRVPLGSRESGAGNIGRDIYLLSINLFDRPPGLTAVA